MKTYPLILILCLLCSCSYLFDNSPKSTKETEVYHIEGKKISLVYSHNINGETHPCGCRTHPLGGLPQVAGQIEEIKQNSYPFYIDTGDTLFDSFVIPESIYESKRYNALELAKELKELGLSLWVPGDQDFALGINFLNEVITTAKLPTLISNLKDPNLIQHKKFAYVQSGPTHLYFLGMIHPLVFQDRNLKRHFSYPKQWIGKAITDLQKEGYEPNNPLHRLILLSHSGLDLDQKTAKDFPQFDWIIGAHTMNFLRTPVTVGKTQIVQVLSRNHYLGEVQLFRNPEKAIVHEVRDEDQDILKPNPFISFVNNHKKKMEELHQKEQEKLSINYGSASPLMTTKQCIDCHSAQTDHWAKTAHSVSYLTLVHANEGKNLQCVKCHSVGLGQKGGFFKADEIVKIQDEQKKKNYWKEIDAAFGKSGSIRELDPGTRMKMSLRWRGIDQKYEVEHNYANVQCLNCHQLHREHPFQDLKHPENYDKTSEMQKACLGCHTKDQSPEWYIQMPNGLPGDVDLEKLTKLMKEISCKKAP